MKNMDVRIIDRYHLSKQYTPVTIMEVYYDSILFELEKYWTLEYNLLKNSSWEFEGRRPSGFRTGGWLPCKNLCGFFGRLFS